MKLKVLGEVSAGTIVITSSCLTFLSFAPLQMSHKQKSVKSTTQVPLFPDFKSSLEKNRGWQQIFSLFFYGKSSSALAEKEGPGISQILIMDNLQPLKTTDFGPAQAKTTKNQHGVNQQNKMATGL